MLGLVLFLLVLAIAAWAIPPVRVRIVEAFKAFSDLLVVLFLRTTSQFESELTEDGRAEQKLWREQRLRNLRGLARRSEQKRRANAKEEAGLS